MEKIVEALEKKSGLIVYCTPLSVLPRLAFRGNWDYFRMNKPKYQNLLRLCLNSRFVGHVGTMSYLIGGGAGEREHGG